MTLRLAFMGTPDFAVPLLAELIAEGHDIAAVYSQPPRPKGRGMKEVPSPVAALALKHDLEVRTPVSLRKAEPQAEFAALNLDVAVVAAYGLLLPKPILDAPRLGCWNLHGSLLPRWRGAAPIQRAVMAGDTETGVMVMQMEEGLDTGPYLLTAKTLIGRKTAGELTDELAATGAKLMAQGLRLLESGSVTATPQGDEGATYAKKILKDEARIDWTQSAAEVDCHIRGLSPWPGAFSEAGGERLKILYAEPVDGRGAPGTVLDDQLTIACGSGAVRLTRVQRPGKAAMAAADLLRGWTLAKGTVLV
ncbi:methionyl-tRNA formyltransferase [Rhizomicrobium electricum]|uniref:Methionyl-tRNA formyltransferase n=1 Tax=Rhizomicrobium electricum TaxID=480070 RepID=A0ABP3Q5W8_9PROT|nr:methionyl-tRNA formyltransferase [Rhizomicrobium electricum]NIJ49455.1 methionyl-tRNA formyltransferase [Rhizomicrobium electricum]